MFPVCLFYRGPAVALAILLMGPPLWAESDEVATVSPPTIETLLAERRYEEARASLVDLADEWERAVKAKPAREAKIDWARALLSLGMVEDRLARYDVSSIHLEKALELLTDNEASTSLRGDCLDALGLTSNHAGRLAAAEKWFTRAITLRSAAPEAEREPGLSASRDQLGLTYLAAGRHQEASRLFRDSLAATPPDAHALLARRHGHLGRYHHSLHGFARARDHFEQAVAHAEAAWGRDDPNSLRLLGDLGLTVFRLGQLAQARTILEEVTTLARQDTGETPGALRLAGFLNTLGCLALLEAEPDEARRLFLESLQVLEQRLGPDAFALAPIWNNLGCALRKSGAFKQADQCFEKSGRIYLDTVGPEHQGSVEALANRAINTLLGGDPDRAENQVAASTAAATRLLDHLTRFGSDYQRLTALRRADSLSLACTAGTDPELIANTLLASKGRLLDVLRAADPGEASPVLDALRASQHQLDRLLASPDTEPDQLRKLRTKLRALEGQLDSTASSSTAPASWEQIQASLPPGSAFVDFVRYLDYNDSPKWPARYGAILILPDDLPRWIPLGSEEDLQTWLTSLARRLRSRANTHRGTDDLPALKPELRHLHRQFWEPIAAFLPPETRSLCLCPDASLNLLSFAVLLDGDKQFLASRYELGTYVSSGRDLLVPARDSGPLAAPGAAFRIDLPAPSPSPNPQADGVPNPLAIPGLARHLQGIDNSPLPLNHRGLVLHRIDPTPPNNSPPGPGGNNIRLIPDIATLPLSETRLAILSCAHPALEQPLAGEGILELRRCFALAGTQNILLTLWPVTDDTTSGFMRRFHSIAAETKHLSQAVWQTQRESLAAVDPDKPASLENAVLTLSPFVLNQYHGLTPPRHVTPPPPPPVPNKLWRIVSATSGVLAVLFLLATWRRKTA